MDNTENFHFDFNTNEGPQVIPETCDEHIIDKGPHVLNILN